MKIRSSVEVLEAMKDLQVYEEDEWDFLSVLGDSTDMSLNVDCFQDMQDVEFLRRDKKITFMSVLPIVLFIGLLCVFVVIGLWYYGVFDKVDYDATSSVVETAPKVVVERIEGGETCSEDVSAALTKQMEGYFKVLERKEDYAELSKYCVGTCVFRDTYKSFTDSMKSTYDSNDCKARSLRMLGSFCGVASVTEVLKDKDNMYHCYVDLRLPKDLEITSFVYGHSYNYTKTFTSSDMTEANILKYTLGLLKDDGISYKSKEYELCFVKDGGSGSYLIVDDSEISIACSQAYNDVVMEVTKLLKNNVAVQN